MTRRDRAAIQRERAAVRERYGALFDRISRVLFEADPIGMARGTSTNEYDLEVGTILPRLERCRSEAEALDVIHEEHARWLSPEIAGPKARYAAVAASIWRLWQAR